MSNMLSISSFNIPSFSTSHFSTLDFSCPVYMYGPFAICVKKERQ